MSFENVKYQGFSTSNKNQECSPSYPKQTNKQKNTVQVEVQQNDTKSEMNGQNFK